jgi:hypothetical protein
MKRCEEGKLTIPIDMHGAWWRLAALFLLSSWWDIERGDE